VVTICLHVAPSSGRHTRDKIPKSENTVGWGCKTSSLQTNCFVIDNIETQLIRHIALFHAIKENRTNWNSFVVSFFSYTFTFCAILDKSYSKKLHVKIEKVAKSCNIKFMETAQNIELHIFWVYRKLLEAVKKSCKSCKNLSWWQNILTWLFICIFNNNHIMILKIIFTDIFINIWKK